MDQQLPDWIKYRWLRPDADRWMRPDAERYMKPAPFDREAFLKEYRAEQAKKAAEAAALAAAREREERQELFELLRLKSDIAWLRFQRAMVLHMIALRRKSNFNPSQPRVPAGNPDGGQWTSEGGSVGSSSDGRPSSDERVRISPINRLFQDQSGEDTWKWYLNEYRSDGSLARQTVSNRDGSAIQSLFAESALAAGWDERHQVMLADRSVTTFENSGPTQTIYDGAGNQLDRSVWTEGGSEPDETVGLARRPTPEMMEAGKAALEKAWRASVVLYGWLSSRNSPQSTAVIEFRAREFVYDPSNAESLPTVRQLTEQEVKSVCLLYGDVQGRLDSATDAIRTGGKFRDRADFGTKVHTSFAASINALKEENYRAEISAYKSEEAARKEIDPAKRLEVIIRGELDTVRVDAFEHQPENRTTCVYDPKTGRTGLPLRRMRELADGVKWLFPDTERIILIEMRETLR